MAGCTCCQVDVSSPIPDSKTTVGEPAPDSEAKILKPPRSIRMSCDDGVPCAIEERATKEVSNRVSVFKKNLRKGLRAAGEARSMDRWLCDGETAWEDERIGWEDRRINAGRAGTVEPRSWEHSACALCPGESRL